MGNERHHAGLLFAGIAALLLGWLTEETLTGGSARFDAYLRARIHQHASPGWTAVMWIFTDLGTTVALAILLAGAIGIFRFLEWRRGPAILAITMAGSVVLVETLKPAFHRPRPTPFFGIAAPHSFSYPSGHALYSLAFFGMLASLIGARTARLWVRAAIWAAAIIVIGLIGLSRIYLGVHYPSDVLAGYLVAFLWVMAVNFGERLRRRRE